jgi:hypothetical protein
LNLKAAAYGSEPLSDSQATTFKSLLYCSHFTSATNFPAFYPAVLQKDLAQSSAKPSFRRSRMNEPQSVYL